jgi:hypothetical protein
MSDDDDCSFNLELEPNEDYRPFEDELKAHGLKPVTMNWKRSDRGSLIGTHKFSSVENAVEAHVVCAAARDRMTTPRHRRN